MSRIGLDLDGVCYDFAASLRAYLGHAGLKFGYECPDPTRWEFYEDWGYTLDEFIALCHRGADAGFVFSHGDAFPGVTDAVNTIRAAGHTVHVITDRSFGAEGVSEAATRAWLDRNGIRFDSLTFSADKTIVRTDYMIDDKLANYDALDAAGCKVYLLDRPWNQDEGTRRRVTTLDEFARVIA